MPNKSRQVRQLQSFEKNKANQSVESKTMIIELYGFILTGISSSHLVTVDVDSGNVHYNEIVYFMMLMGASAIFMDINIDK